MLQWGLIVTVLVGIAVAFNPFGNNRIQPSFRNENQVWMLRFKLVGHCFIPNFIVPFWSSFINYSKT